MAIQRRPMYQDDYSNYDDTYASPAQPPNATMPATTPAPPNASAGPVAAMPASTSGPTQDQVGAAYQKYLGRPMQSYEYANWAGNGNYENEIASSPEAQAYSQGQSYTRSYAPAAGWDAGKLNDPNKSNTKYNFGRAAQEFTGYGRGNLQPLVDYYDSKYGGHAKVTGPDTIDFGEGYGPVDVLNGNGDTLQWLVPGSGGAAAGTDTGAASAGSNGTNLFDYGTGASGINNGSDGGGNFGQDDFSKLITGKLSDLIANNGRVAPDQEALQLENVRQAADRARRAEYEGVMSTLANRGALPEDVQGGQGGLALDALGRIERNDIAPMMSAGVRDYLIHNSDVANTNLMGALNQGTQRQGVLSNIALSSLAQNQAFNEFLAQYGLDRDRTLAEIAQGQNSQLINALLAYLHGADVSAGGYV